MPSAESIKAMQDKLLSLMYSSVVMAAAAVADRINLFEVLRKNTDAEAGTFLSVDEISKLGDYNQRYIVEIMGCLAGVGLVEYDETTDGFAVTEVQGKMFSDPDFVPFGCGWMDMIPALYQAIPGVVEAAKNSKEMTGVPFSNFAAWGFARGMERKNGSAMRRDYATKWLPESLPEWIPRLEAGIAVADLGTGAGGVVAASLAKAFPASQVTGVDIDASSIERAKTLHRDVPNLTFVCDDIGNVSPGSFDLVVNRDCIHDLAQPLEVLAAVQRSLKPGGVFFSLEPKVRGESMQETQRAARSSPDVGLEVGMWYGISCLHCMTVSCAQGGIGLGCATFGPKCYEKLSKAAGFADFKVVGSNDNDNFYKLTAPGDVA